jgi:hypothetical protein
MCEYKRDTLTNGVSPVIAQGTKTLDSSSNMTETRHVHACWNFTGV